MSLCKASYVFLACLALVVAVSEAQLYEDDRCTSGNGAVGICKKIGDCIGAKENIKNNERPTICSFDKSLPIVCCHDRNINTNPSNTVFAQVLPQWTDRNPPQRPTQRPIVPDQSPAQGSQAERPNVPDQWLAQQSTLQPEAGFVAQPAQGEINGAAQEIVEPWTTQRSTKAPGKRPASQWWQRPKKTTPSE